MCGFEEVILPDNSLLKGPAHLIITYVYNDLGEQMGARFRCINGDTLYVECSRPLVDLFPNIT